MSIPEHQLASASMRSLRATQPVDFPERLADAGLDPFVAAGGIYVGAACIAEAILDDSPYNFPSHLLPTPWLEAVPDPLLIIGGAGLVLCAIAWMVGSLRLWERPTTWLLIIRSSSLGSAITWLGLGLITLMERPAIVSGGLWVILSAGCFWASTVAHMKMRRSELLTAGGVDAPDQPAER